MAASVDANYLRGLLRVGRQRAYPSGFLDDGHRPDGGDLRGAGGGHQPRRTADGTGALSGQPAEIAQRDAGFTDATLRHLRGTGQWHRQSSRRDRALSTSSAPVFEALSGFARATLFGRKPLAEMDRSERVRACYLHACLKYVNRDFLTNASLRKRFNIRAAMSASTASIASRYIREAREAGYIKPLDPQARRRKMRYVPSWAPSDSQGLY